MRRWVLVSSAECLLIMHAMPNEEAIAGSVPTE